MALLVKLGWSKASNQDKVYVNILIAKYLCKEKLSKVHCFGKVSRKLNH